MHLELMLKEFNDHICYLYEKTKCLLQNDFWSTVAPKGCVNRLRIHQLSKNSTKEQSHEVTVMEENIVISKPNYSYITCNIEEIFKSTECCVTQGKTILIEGVSGIGKTFLCKEMAYRWSHKELLQSDKLVLLVLLRDLAVQNITSVADLVQYMYGSRSDDEVIKISKACATYLMNSEGINVTIILDGFDELLQLKRKNKLISDLLHKKILPKCKVIVSSRPLVSKQLQQIADIKVKLLRLTEENRWIYINNKFKDNCEKLVKVKLYLNENININQLCYNPFMVSVLVCVAKEYEELPNSVTKLYSKFIAYTISKYVQKFQSDFYVTDLNALPVKVKCHFLKLCKYAFNILQNGKTVFTANEIIQDFVTLADAQTRWSALGLLTSSQFVDTKDDNVYSFLHLSIQEYLAAFYITTLSTSEQINIIKEFFFVDKFLNMWIVYCGLSDRPTALIHFLSGGKCLLLSELFAIHKLSQPIAQSKIKCLYLHQCLPEITSQRLYTLVNTSFEKGILDLSNCSLMMEDIDTLKYILDRSSITHWDELNLSSSNIDDAGFHQICKVINGNGIIFNRINLSGNQLLTTKSLKTIADIIVCCKAQTLHLPDNFKVNADTTLMHLAMEYAFRQTALKYSLIINSCNQEDLIFSRLDAKTIIAHLYSKKMITGIHFFHCKVDNEIAIAISVIITKQRPPCKICLWNSHVSSNAIQHILSLMLQKEENQLLFVYETSPSANSDIMVHQFDEVISSMLTFIYLTESGLVLHSVHDKHNTFMSFLNTIFSLKAGTLTKIQLSNTKITEDNISSFSQIFSKCRTLSRCVLLNNILDFHLLQQLINSVNSLSTLSQIIIEDNNVTFNDLCAIAHKLGSHHLHTVTIFCNNKSLRVYRSHDKQLSNGVISTIMKLYEINYIVVYEKYLTTESVSFIHDVCRSLPIAHIFLCNTILFAKNIKNSQLFLMMLNSSFPASSITEVILSNCELNAKLTQLLTKTFSHCKLLRKITCDNDNFTSPKRSLSFFIISIMELPSLQQIVAYERNLAMDDIDKINRMLIKNSKNLCVIITTNDKLIGYKLSSVSFNEALNLNLTVTDVWYCFVILTNIFLKQLVKFHTLKGLQYCKVE